MIMVRIRKPLSWFLIFLLGYGHVFQVAALTLATTPLAATTTTVVRPNLMYVLDDSGSMAWDYTPDYINDDTVTDPTSSGATPAGSSGDTGSATISGGVITAISATGGNIYEHATPTVLIQGDGTGAAATVTLGADKKIQSVTVTSGGTGYTSGGTYITFLGGLKTAGWGMCWGTTSTSTTAGAPKDTSVSPKCTTRSQMPYSTSKINYQYYDPAIRYLPPIKADGTSYASASITAAPVSSTTSSSYKDTLTSSAPTTTTNLTTGYEHEVWCSTSSPTSITSGTIATHAQCKENTDTTSNALYPNAAYTFRKTYSGAASYYIMEPSEYCSDAELTSCITANEALTASPAFVVSGVTYNVPSYYRWCSYYNSVAKSFGGCQSRRDLDHYIPNYLGGWVSSGSAGVQATAELVINATTAGQQLTAVTVGGTDIVGGATFTSASNGDQNTIASNVCTAIQSNTGTTGYSCAVTNSTVTIQAANVGTTANGRPVLATGPTTAATNSTGTLQVTSVADGQSITAIRIGPAGTGTQLLSANVTANSSDINATAKTICEAINSGAQQGVYVARSDVDADIAATAWGTCELPDTGRVEIKRIPADTAVNGLAVTVEGPATSTLNQGSITITSTTGATSLSTVTRNGSTALISSALSIADGTATDSIASSLRTSINTGTGTHGCTATASGNVVTLTGAGCTGALAVTSASTQATATMKVTSTTHTYGADLGGIQVGATSIAGNINSTSVSNGTSVSTNATAVRTAINAGTGTHGFTAAAPVASGSDYNITVTAPVGTTYNGQSFSFQNGTAVAAGSATSPTWSFGITGATTNDKVIDYLRCDNGSSVYFASTDSSTGTASAGLDRTTNLANALNSNNINGYTYSCVRQSGTQDNYICDVTGPTGVSACVSDLTLSDLDSSSGITLDTYSMTAGAAACTSISAPTWQFEIGTFDSATSADQLINSITCGGTNTVTPNTVTTENGSNTSDSDTRRTTLMNNLVANDINGYSYSCSQSMSNNKVSCTVTGPAAAAACTSLSFSMNNNINLNYNNDVVQTCPAVTTGSSSTWRFTINSATTDSKRIRTIKCGTTNTITADAVSTGVAGNADVTRINNLTTALQANDENGYTVSCTSATAGTVSSTCTVTGPAGASACTQADYDCSAGQMRISHNSTISLSGGAAAGDAGSPAASTKRYCVSPTSSGSSGATAVDDFAPYLFTVSAFSGGAPSQTTSVSGMASTTIGTIGTSTVAMSAGAASTDAAVSTNATGVIGNSIAMAGGTAADTASNHWTRVGIFKRKDIINDGRTFTRASGRTDCVSSTCTYTEEMQNFANWYSYYRTRMLTMKSATSIAFSQLDGNYRVGFDNICQATGTTVDNPVAQFESTGRSSWWTSLTNATPACATPLRAETAKIGRYFAHLGGSADPMQYSCQRNYMLLVTDGYWNESDSSSIKGVTGADIGNTDNTLATAGRPYYDGAQTSTTCPVVGTTRSAASSCRTLADIAYYYYSTDMRTAALGNNLGSLGTDVATNNVIATNEDKNQVQHMNFFAMGLGIEGKLAFRSDYDTASSGDYAAIAAGTKNWPAVSNLDPTGVDDLWHATVNGRGKYFSARNVPSVVAGLREALNKIGARVGSAAAAATSNLEPVAGDNYAYVASYTTLDWTGDLQSRSIDTATGVVSPDTECTIAGTGCQWSAQNKLDNMTWSARRIKIKPSSGTSGDPLRAFAYGNLSGTEQAYFNPSSLSQYAALSVSNPSDITASNLVDFLRGNRSLEQDGDVSHAQIWRRRAHALGDIVNTQPVYLKAPSASYEDGGYAGFKAGTAAGRKPVVFVSAQDGMLHAFNAYTSAVTVSGTSVEPGEEMWAFLPTQTMQLVKSLADVNYSHQYFVDGLITVADVDFGSGDWHTILIGGMGAGGTAYYALDVTDPTDPKYLWEFQTANLGYTFSNAAVSKLPNGEWAVFFTSGYNSTGDGVGYLYALNPQTGGVKTGYPLSTSSGTNGSPSNLGKLAIWADTPGTNNTAQYVYAGDLNGDLWRFDLDHNNTYGTGHSGTQVFKLAHFEKSLTPQPITTKPELTKLTDGTHVVYVGTGKYLEVADLTNTDVQTMYAIKDTLGVANLGGAGQDTWNPQSDTTVVSIATVDTTVSMFLPRSFVTTKEDGSAVTTTIDGVTRDARQICAGASATVTAGGACNNVDARTMDWSVYGGWYADFPETSERLNVDPKLVRGSVVIATNVPSATSCTTGGDAYFSVLDFQTGLGIEGESKVSTKLSGSLAVGLTVIKLSTGEYKAIVTKSDYQQETLAVPVSAVSAASGSNTFGSKRGLWREFEAY